MKHPRRRPLYASEAVTATNDSKFGLGSNIRTNDRDTGEGMPSQAAWSSFGQMPLSIRYS